MATAQIEPELIGRLHRILRQRSDLESRIRKCPMRVKVAQGAVDKLEQELAADRDSLKQNRMKADQKQLQLNEREARIADVKIKRNTCGSNREYQVLTTQIEADVEANGVLADEILEVLDQVDTLDRGIREKQEALVGVRAEAVRLQADCDVQLEQLRAELDSVNGEYAQAEKHLPSDIRATIRRMVDAIGEQAIAQVENQCCGHCYTTQTTQAMSELTLKQVVFCKSCGSLLYLPQGAPV
jgi:predicted  nucleic acid-binding Zn-ribbon protein